MVSVNTINTVGMVNVIMVKMRQHVHKNVQKVVAMASVLQWKTVIIAQVIVENVSKCLGAEMACVMEMKIVEHVLVIVVNVLPQNIVGIIFVTMGKLAIHVAQIVQCALMCVEMVIVQAQKIVCLALLIVAHAPQWLLAGWNV